VEISLVETNENVPVEHQNVPVEHRGMHDFLYSSDDEHSSTVTAAPNLNGAQVMPLEAWCKSLQNVKFAGVYAVLDVERCTQYVGYSRNVLLSLKGHLTKNGQQTCAFVRVQTFKFPKREEMEKLRDTWISEFSSVPPGNGGASERWASTGGEVALAAMSATERNAYEEKMLKLRKAIADTTLGLESEARDESDTSRRQELEAAVKNDNWSSVIDSQTQETRSRSK
jgi:hypothetical protein